MLKIPATAEAGMTFRPVYYDASAGPYSPDSPQYDGLSFEIDSPYMTAMQCDM